MAFIFGKDFKMYYDAAGAADGQGTPANWLENQNVKDLTLNLETAVDDVTTRGSGGFRQNAATLKDGSVDFQMVYDPADADFAAFQDAFFGNGSGFASGGGQTIGIAIMDGVITVSGSQGLVADMMITNFSLPQNLEEAGKVDVTVQPTFSQFTPVWFVTP